MSKILVTGANGFVGRHVVRELLAHEYDVLAVGGQQFAGDYIEGQDCLILDLSKPKEVSKIDFSELKGVIHLAGLAAVKPSFDQPLEYLKVNAGIEINLFETALTQNASPRFIIVSSSTLYDPKTPQPLSEQSSLLPTSPYAVSKIAQEELARYYSSRGIESIIARPFNHIGSGQSLGFLVSDLAAQIVSAEAKNQNEIAVGNLDSKRDYTDVRDVAAAYRSLLEKGQSGETYNICSGRAVSGHEILAGLQAAAGTNLSVKPDPNKMRPSDAPEIYGNGAKISRETGWKSSIALETTLADVIADWRQRHVT